MGVVRVEREKEEGSHVGDAPNDIFILQFFEQRYLADGGAGHPFIFRFEPDLLQSHHLSRVDVLCLVYNPVCP